MSLVKFIKGCIDVFLVISLIAYSVFAYLAHNFNRGFGGSSQLTFNGYLFEIVLFLPIAYLSLLFLISLSKIKINKFRCFILLGVQLIFGIILVITYFHALTMSESYSSSNLNAMLFRTGFFLLFTVIFWGVLGVINHLNNKGARNMWSKWIWIEEEK